MKEIKKSRVISSLFWKFLERSGTQGIQFIVQVVLARLLVPEDYGVVALVVVFTSIATVFVQSGFGTALIQKKDADEVDFSSVFFLSLALASFIYVILFFAAPYVADFYNMPILSPLTRVLSINLIFGAVNSIQNAIISRSFQFKLLFFRSVGALLISGTVGIVMAYTGYGVWALAGQLVTNQIAITLILWVTLRWRPSFIFSFSRVKKLFTFGWKLLVSSLLDTSFRELRNLVIGKIFDPAILGIYNRGQQFPSMLVSNVDGSIQAVIFPVLATSQDDTYRAKMVMRRSIISSSFVIFPLMVGLAATAESVVLIVLTEKWLPSVPFLQIACVVFALMPIQTANLQAINALGRSDIFLKLEIIKKTIGLMILMITIFMGIYAIAIGGIVSAFLSSLINAFPNKHLLDYSYTEQVRDVIPSLALSLFMGMIVYVIKWLGLPTVLLLTAQVIVGIVIYVGMAKLLKMESYTYLIETIKVFFRKRRTLTED